MKNLRSDGLDGYYGSMALNQELFGRVGRRARNASLIDLLASPQVKKKCNAHLNNSILGHHIPKLVDATQSSRLTVFRLRHFAASHADLEKEEGGRFGYRVSLLACMHVGDFGH